MYRTITIHNTRKLKPSKEKPVEHLLKFTDFFFVSKILITTIFKVLIEIILSESITYKTYITLAGVDHHFLNCFDIRVASHTELEKEYVNCL